MATGTKPSLSLLIEPGDWGDARIQDIGQLLCDVAKQLVRHFSDPPTGRVRVQCRPNESNPRVLYRQSSDDDYIVWLTARDRLWSKLAYQFAHEFCHIACDYERLRASPNNWFQESLCELASIFAIKQMGTMWQSAPPYPNWRDYASSLDKYADDLINRETYSLAPGVSLGEWLRINESGLRADSCQRELNGVVACQLLPLLQNAPQHWQAVRHMPDTSAPFGEFLSLWHQACRDQHKIFVSQIANLFSFKIPDKD